MEQLAIDGVPVFWSRGPEPMTATLTFGCGVRDETFRTLGVTHLIEHLAMSTLPRVFYDHNAAVDLETTQFFATGRPAQLVEFLELVCRAMDALPLERIEKEAGVLAAEGSSVTHTTAGTLLTRRFGATGHGLAQWVGPGYDRIPAEAVAAHAARFFTRANAVLTLTGPPPEGLRLPLPDGSRPVHQASVPLPVDGPRWMAEHVPCPGLAMTGPAASAPWTIGIEVLRERLTTIARREKGLSYDVGADQAEIAAGRSDRFIWLDAREGREAEVATILWDTARQLATLGPEPEEIAHEVAAFAELATDPRMIAGDLDLRARAELLGERYRSLPDWRDELAAVTPDQVVTAMAEGMRTALLVVPADCLLELSDLDGAPIPVGGCARTDTVPAGQVFRAPLRARMTSGAARRARLVLTNDGVARCDDDGDVHLVRFADVVGVEVNADARTVYGRAGCVVPVDPDLFRGAEAAVTALDAAIDPGLHYQRTDLISFD